MEIKKRVTLSWSGGKDSMLALHEILCQNQFDVVSLHTTINKETRRVGMHGVDERLVEDQAQILGFPLKKLYTPSSVSHGAYENVMNQFFSECKSDNVEAIVYGDIFLEDLRSYRDQLLQPWGIDAVYPLWLKDSTELIKQFLSAGYRTVICVANNECYKNGFLGTTIGHDFMIKLPHGIDPCGERGEFHTFVYDGPLFKRPVRWNPGQVVSKSYAFKTVDEESSTTDQNAVFWFQDLVPVG